MASGKAKGKTEGQVLDNTGNGTLLVFHLSFDEAFHFLIHLFQIQLRAVAQDI